MFDKILRDIVFQINCGYRDGTAFLISNSYAITVFHTVKEHNEHEIKLSQHGEFVVKAKLMTYLNEKSKTMDFALLKLEEVSKCTDFINLGYSENIPTGIKWISRGYPKSKMISGDNLNQNDNTINQHLSVLKSKKIDIELNHNKKWPSYEGISGAPLVIDGRIVGIINSELIVGEQSAELNALSLKYLKETLLPYDIIINEINFEDVIKSTDVIGTSAYEDLNSNDKRNLSDKLIEASNNKISKHWINLYSREQALGKAEMDIYDDQQISAMKYRVFEVCQLELLKFVEKNQKADLTTEQIEELITSFSEKGKIAIQDRSESYNYPLNNADFMRKVVLDLINDCFISFDEKGLYEEE